MKLARSKYEKVDALSKIIGLIILAISVDNVFKGDYFFALVLFALGGIISIIPMFIEVEI